METAPYALSDTPQRSQDTQLSSAATGSAAFSSTRRRSWWEGADSLFERQLLSKRKLCPSREGKMQDQLRLEQ